MPLCNSRDCHCVQIWKCQVSSHVGSWWLSWCVIATYAMLSHILGLIIGWSCPAFQLWHKYAVSGLKITWWKHIFIFSAKLQSKHTLRNWTWVDWSLVKRSCRSLLVLSAILPTCCVSVVKFPLFFRTWSSVKLPDLPIAVPRGA